MRTFAVRLMTTAFVDIRPAGSATSFVVGLLAARTAVQLTICAAARASHKIANTCGMRRDMR
jgi:hypothetical protein